MDNDKHGDGGSGNGLESERILVKISTEKTWLWLRKKLKMDFFTLM